MLLLIIFGLLYTLVSASSNRNNVNFNITKYQSMKNHNITEKLKNNSNGIHIPISTNQSTPNLKVNNSTYPQSSKLRKKKPTTTTTTTTQAPPPVSLLNIPVHSKPELQLLAPQTIQVTKPSIPQVQFVQPPNVELNFVPKPPKPIPIPTVPELDIVQAPAQVFQLPLIPQVSLGNSITSLLPTAATTTPAPSKPKPDKLNIISNMLGLTTTTQKPNFLANILGNIANQNQLSSIFGLKPLKPSPLLNFLGLSPTPSTTTPNPILAILGLKPTKPKPQKSLIDKIIQAINKVEDKFTEVTDINATTINKKVKKVKNIIKILLMDSLF